MLLQHLLQEEDVVRRRRPLSRPLLHSQLGCSSCHAVAARIEAASVGAINGGEELRNGAHRRQRRLVLMPQVVSEH